MTKKGRPFLRKKIGVTPSVAAPGDTNPSNATARIWRNAAQHSIGQSLVTIPS